MRERHQRPRVKDLGNKWKVFYWDYGSAKRCGRTKSWAKSKVPTRGSAGSRSGHRRRIRSYQDRCRSQEHSARFPRNLVGGSGCSLAEVEVSETGRSHSYQCKTQKPVRPVTRPRSRCFPLEPPYARVFANKVASSCFHMPSPNLAWHRLAAQQTFQAVIAGREAW